MNAINSKLKILIISNNYSPYTGISCYANNLFNNLISQGHTVKLLNFAHITYDYYVMSIGDRARQVLIQPSNLSTGINSQFNSALLQSIPMEYSRVWHIEQTDLSYSKEKREAVISMFSHNYKVVYEKSLTKITITLYEN